jgi:glycosyltransferase involved in cell wall biosynthesis
MNIIIVTNSYGRALSLVERSLKHSLALTDQVSQVVFIDQNSEKLILDPELESHNHLKHLHVLKNCVSAARNSFEIPLGTDWIIFCDDDGYIDSNYILVFKDMLKNHPELDIIAGSIIRDDNFDFYSPRHKIGGDLNKFRNTKLLMGSNFAVKASVFKELGGFDERFGIGSYLGSGEETDFAWKAYFNNNSMKYCPEMKVFHIKPYAGTYIESKAKAFHYGIGKGALVSKWLFQNMKLVVLYEFIEMFLVPTIKIIFFILSMKFKDVMIQVLMIKGRMLGLFRFFNPN